jgi:cold shock CspA family protein
MRFSGTLRSWNDDRGFGFVAPTHGGAELFVHISALPGDGTRPTIGETLTYELGRGKDGRPQAVNVLRLAIGQGAAEQTRTAKPIRRRSHATITKFVGLVLILALGAYAYKLYEKRIFRNASTAQPRSQPSTPQPARVPAQATESPAFRCDGRTRCSQMTSCTEAKFFSNNCPGTQMDGDHDGIPCEEQWCTSP